VQCFSGTPRAAECRLRGTLNPQWVKGAIATEPAGCRGANVDTAAFPNPDPVYSNQEIATLAQIPILVCLPTFRECTLANQNRRLQGIGQSAQGCGWQRYSLVPSTIIGIHGNTHMFMLDKIIFKLARLVSKWIDENVQVDRQEREGEGR